MEKEVNKPKEKYKPFNTSQQEKSDGIIVAFVKKMLNINFLKWGVTKDF